jgi:hypothetical protein
MPAASHGITLQVDWADRRQEPGTHAAQVQRISKLVNLDPSQQAADPEISYAMFKKRAAMAVRRSDLMCKLKSCSKSTVRKYLQAHSHMDVLPNKMQSYLDGTISIMSAGMQTKLLFKAAVRTGTAPACPQAQDRSSRWPIGPVMPVLVLAVTKLTAAHFALDGVPTVY